MVNAERPLRVGIAGVGAIGAAVGRALLAGAVPGLMLSAVAVRDATSVARRLGSDVPALSFEELATACDIVVESAPRAVFRWIAEPAIEAGRTFVPLSVGALLDEDDLIETARRTGARILVPTGALLGLDAVKAAAEGHIASATLISRKPPAGLAGAPYLLEHGIDVENLTEPLLVFSGNARDAARGFPANVNVGAALSLAGIGPDRTEVQIWADPGVERNTHRIVVEADSARLTMMIENIPSDENPKTGRITALSTLTLLRGLTSTLRVGS